MSVDWAANGLDEETTVVLKKPDASAKLGMTLAVFTNDVPHPRIQEMREGAVASNSGLLRIEDVIVSINGTVVKDDTEAAEILGQAGLEVQLCIRRSGAVAGKTTNHTHKGSIAAQESLTDSSGAGETRHKALSTSVADAGDAEELYDNLQKQSPKFPNPWQPRTVKANNAGGISYFSGGGDQKTIKWAEVSTIMATDAAKYEFELRTHGRAYKFMCPDQPTYDRWVKGLRKMLAASK